MVNRMDHLVYPGMKLVCVDDTGMQPFLRLCQTYQVKEVSHRGALIRLWGVSMLVASNRFVPANSNPVGNTEGVNASA